MVANQKSQEILNKTSTSLKGPSADGPAPDGANEVHDEARWFNAVFFLVSDHSCCCLR